VPELPEVEVIKRGIAPHVAGRKVIEIYYSGLALRRPLSFDALREGVVDQKILSVSRRAKYLVMAFQNNARLVIHLGMSGRLGMFPSEQFRVRHDHLCLTLDNGMDVRFNDARRFGSVQVVSPAITEKDLFKNLGPEPFGSSFSAAYLFRKAKNKKQPVKNFLMDSHIVAGIGNIYASEILFEAAIMPDKEAGELDKKQWQQIVHATVNVLNSAIDCGGTTISDFVNSSGESGYFQLELQVYGRANLSCKRCNTPITRTVMAGRATYFCERCQK
jgi:formamidopyrimidine-DNA glycosylase